MTGDAAQMLRAARTAAGLSARALAHCAGTSTTTVTRIEAGSMDPTIGMLGRLLEASGRSLELRLGESRPSSPVSLADLTDAWTRTTIGDRPDWTRLRALLDGLALRPERTRAAIAPTPPLSGSAMMDALLAAIADKLADDQGLKRPVWTKKASRFLTSPWETPGTPRMKHVARGQTPSQLLSHGIIASSDSLWREPAARGLSASV